jgi:glutathione S-transferase
MTQAYTLYAADFSLYSGKARAYMQYKGLRWHECESTLDVYKNIIIPNVGAGIIPVLKTADGDFVQDTTEIIDYLELRHPQGSVYPTTPKQRIVSLLLEFFGDEWLFLPAMHYRWNYLHEHRDFILSAFGGLGIPDGTLEEKIAMGEKLYAPFRDSTAKMGVTEQTRDSVEASYLATLDQLNQHFEEYDFLLGSRPSIGDFGLMAPLYAHLGRDPYPKAIMQGRAPAVYRWVERMNSPKPLSGEFLPNDEIPESLIPILKTQCREQLPDVLKVIDANANWLEQNLGGNLPRFLGSHEFTIGGSTGRRWVSTYTQWMFQRPLFYYQSLPAPHDGEAKKLLEEIGGLAAMETNIRHPLARKPGQLELIEY